MVGRKNERTLLNRSGKALMTIIKVLEGGGPPSWTGDYDVVVK